MGVTNRPSTTRFRSWLRVVLGLFVTAMTAFVCCLCWAHSGYLADKRRRLDATTTQLEKRCNALEAEIRMRVDIGMFDRLNKGEDDCISFPCDCANAYFAKNGKAVPPAYLANGCG